MHSPRTLLLCALLLDWFGQLFILAFILAMPIQAGIAHDGFSLEDQVPWLLYVLLLYPSLGWLFGSYTVLRWRRLSLPVLLQRLLLTAAVTLMIVAFSRWLISPSDASGYFIGGCCRYGLGHLLFGPSRCGWVCEEA